jgi:hypothetical protein
MRNHWKQLLEKLGHKEGETIVDIGGAYDPVPIADLVIDLCDMGKGGKSYKILDITSEILPYPNNCFDIAICSQTLEDVTCPTLALKEMSRIAKRGVIEVPHRGKESVKQMHPEWETPDGSVPYTYGSGHHKWLIEVVNDKIVFTPKLYYMLMRYPIPKWTGPNGLSYIWKDKINFEVVFDIHDHTIVSNYASFRNRSEAFWK